MSRMTASVLAAQPLVQRWALAGGVLVAVACALCAIFPAESTGALHVWLTSTAYNHCFLILPVALYLAWQRRDALLALAPKPTLWPLLLIVPLSALWLVAARLSVLEAQQFLVMAMFEAAALGIVGFAVYRAFLTPFLYLFFLVPSGYFLVPYLQDFTARFIVHGLELLQIPVFSDGTIIEVPSGDFVVAEACAGLRFLIASIAFGVLFATLMYRSRLRRAIFIALSIVVPIIANGFRGLGLIVLSEISGSASAVMADHILYGWLFFSLVIVLLIAIGTSFSDTRAVEPKPAPPSDPDGDGARPWRLAAVAAASVILAATGPAYAAFRDLRVSPLPAGLAAPAVAAPWRPDPFAVTLWQPLISAPDRAFHDAFNDGAATVIRYVALYATGGVHDNLVRADNEIADPKRWNIASRGTAIARIGGHDASVASTEIEGGNHRLLVWSFYVLDGRIAAGPMQVKLAELRGLLHGPSSASYVAIATDEGIGRAAAARQVLQKFLDAMAPPGAGAGAR